MLIYTHATMAVLRHSLDADWRVLAVVRAVRVVCWRNKRSKSTAKTNKKDEKNGTVDEAVTSVDMLRPEGFASSQSIILSAMCLCVCVYVLFVFFSIFKCTEGQKLQSWGFLFILSTKIITFSIIFWFDSIWYQIDKYFLFVFDFYSFLFLFKDLHPEFRTVPLATRGILGEPATLECEPPRGHPEPQVRWKKNGQPLDLNVGAHRDHSSARFVPLSFKLNFFS